MGLLPRLCVILRIRGLWCSVGLLWGILSDLGLIVGRVQLVDFIFLVRPTSILSLFIYNGNLAYTAFSVDFIPIHSCRLSFLFHADAGKEIGKFPFHFRVQIQILVQQYAIAIIAKHTKVDDRLVAGRHFLAAGVSGTVELLHGKAVVALRQQNKAALLLDLIVPAQFVSLRICGCGVVFVQV